MRKRLSVRVLSMLLVFAMLFGFAAPAGAVQSHSHLADLSFAETDAASGVADESLAVDETALEAQYASDEIVRVSIVLEKKPTIEAGFSTMGIADNASAMAYRAGLEEDQADLTAKIEDAIGEELDVQWNLTLAANIISADVAYGQIEQIAAVAGVSQVVIEQQYEPAVVDTDEGVDPNTATSGEMIGSSAAYALGYTGAGSRIAIIDTGLDMDHQSFDAAAYEYSLSLLAAQNQMTLPQYKESLDLLAAEEIDAVLSQTNAIKKTKTLTSADLYKTEKVPFAYNYVDKSATKVDHTTDAQGGHGSHVAGIAAANRYIPNGDGTYSVSVDAVSATGVAPDAQIIVMKVFGSRSPYESDYMAAIEDAIILGCDSVNLSLGSNAAGASMSATYQELMESLQDTDTTVVISAGNAGHWADNGLHEEPGYLYAEDVNTHTGGSPGSYTNALTVASADNIGTTGHYLAVDEQLIFYTESVFGNALLRTIAGEHEYILLDSIGTAEEWAAVADVLPGKIAICSRGTTSFFEKAEAAVNNGAIATIICNNQPGSINMDLSTYTKTEPCVSITQAEGAHIKENSTPVTDAEGNVRYYTGTMTISAGIGVAMNEAEFYSMSSFSSYGVNGSLELKPEITAPGGSIYSVDGEIDGGKDYVTMSGTSMAAPQISGMAAILGQYIEEQGLEELTGLTKRNLTISLLMSTAQAIEQSKGKYYPVFRQGAGLADIGAAINANSYVLMGGDATDSWADGKVKAELGDDPERAGVYEFSFTLNNLTDSDQLYMLSADLFTQDSFTSGEYSYMDVVTEALQAELTWTVNGQVLEPAEDVSDHDVTADGLVNTLDVQAIVDYKVGAPTDLVDLDAADVNADGDVTTYDAYLLLNKLNTGLAELAANGTTEVTVSIALTADQKAQLDETFENGAYIQGYFFAEQLPTADGELGTVHSIPMLAFYGQWSDARMFDYGTVDQYYYGYEGRPQYTTQAANYIMVQYDDAGSLTNYIYAGNPYSRLEDENPIDRWAVKSSTTLYETDGSLIRAAGARMAVITDQTGEVLYMSEPKSIGAAYYYAAAGAWQYTSTVLSFRQKVGALGAREDDVLTVYDIAIPEYYTRDGEMTAEKLWELYQTGFLNEGAANTYSFTVDNTAPEMVSVQKDLMTGALTISAKDNNYVASVQVQSPGGTVFAQGLPDQEGENETGTVTLELSEYQDLIGEELMIVVCDYAKNEAAYIVEYGNDPMDYTGKMFAFTESKYRGGGQRWMYIDPDEVWFNNKASDSYGYGGTLNMQLSDVNIQAAEYVGGYVYMAGVDGNFYVAEQGDWNNGVLAGRYKNYTTTILDLAFNYADGKLYALDANATIWTVDLQTLAMERYTTIELYFPITIGFFESLSGVDKPGMMAIDDEGTFYLVNRGSSQLNGFLFSFTAEDVGTGIEEDEGGGGGLFPGFPFSDSGEYETNDRTGTPATGMHPVNDTKEGFLGRYTTVGSLAWDHDKDILYMTGSTGDDATGYSSYILTVNTEDGSASQTNSITGGFDMGCPSRLQTPARALYIVPSESVEIAMLDTATSVGLDKSEGKALAGAQFTLNATVYPWNVTDRSVTWTSSDETIATVSADGVVSLLAEGEVTITATSNLTPACSDACTITVEPMPSIQLTALVTDSDGVSYWSEFTTDDPANVHKVKAEEELYFAGTLSNGMIIAHNNAAYFGIDPDTFEPLGQLGALGNMFRFSDCAESPAIGDRFGTEVVSVANSGTYFEILNYETHRVGYLNVASDLSNDPMATIAYYRSSSTSNYYYVLTEGGQLWSFYVTQSASGGYSIGKSKVGETGMSLPGVSTVTGGYTASMIYDQETGYLFIIATLDNSTKLYALDPVSLVWSEIGTLPEGMYPAVSLYRYERDTELTVKMSETSAYLYMDGTLDLDAAVLPVDMEQGVTWSSSDESIATVDENGVVTPVAPGTVNIIATTVTTDAEGNTAQGICNLKVKDVTSVAAEVKAQIRNDDGTADWVTIDLATMEITTDKEDAQLLYGGGVHDGKIYGTDMLYEGNGGNYYSVDPSNDYAVVTGVAASDIYGILDATTAPAYTMQMTDAEGNPVDIEFFGDIMMLNYTGDFFALYDHVTYTQGYGWGLWNYYSDLSAVAYMGTGTRGGYTSHLYYFLAMDGNLYSLEVWPSSVAADGTVTYTSARAALGNIGVSFAKETDLTMTYVRSENAEGLVIGNNGANNVELYYVDLTEEALTCGKMAELEGTMSISTLYTDAEMNGTIGAYTTEESNEALPEGETAAVMVAASTEYMVSGENEVSGGGLNAVKGAVAPMAAETEKDCAEGIVELTLTADGETGNGLYTVAFDTDAMTLTDVSTAADFYSTLNENGTVTFGYANAELLKAGDAVATLTFQVTAAATVTVTTVEDSDSEPNTVQTVEVPAPDHDYESTETVAPTCTADGYTVWVCSACGDTWTETLEATGHTLVDTVVEPTCVSEGYTQHDCSVCGVSYRDTIVAALGHSYEAVVTDATCESEGYTTYSCANCGHTYTDEYVDALGHDWSDWTVTVEATHETAGEQARTCGNCGETQTEAILPTGHTFTQTVAAPTCEAAGYTRNVCECGHEYITDVVDALGHDWSGWTVTTEPTCDTDGEETRTCAACGAEEKRTAAHLGHSYTVTVVEPTCTEGGYTFHECSVCGDSYYTDLTDAHCPSASFTDVELGTWYHEAVDYVVENGLMNGMSETIFAPGSDMTRAQIVTVLYRLAGSPEVENAAPFTDVPAESYCADAVAWAYANGIVKGVSATQFNPTASVTREQMVTFLGRYAEWSGITVEVQGDLSAYADGDTVSAFAVKYMTWAVESGLIGGVTADTLAPAQTANRAQIALVLMRWCQK